jgi:hypothetical protein
MYFADKTAEKIHEEILPKSSRKLFLIFLGFDVAC